MMKYTSGTISSADRKTNSTTALPCSGEVKTQPVTVHGWMAAWPFTSRSARGPMNPMTSKGARTVTSSVRMP